MKFRLAIFLVILPLILSAFTHMWNLTGFPAVYVDEGHYLRRTLHVIEARGPQENALESLTKFRVYYDHPYFGQLFLASVLGLIGYPDSLKHSIDAQSIEMLYFAPRLLMGVLAVVDTFLIYKIAEMPYNRNVAFISSILFAVMPSTWFIRRVWL